MRTNWSWLLLAAIAGSAGCSKSDGSDVTFNDAELTKIKTFSPLPAPPADLTNAHADDPAAATLGQKFFHEKAFSGPVVDGSGNAPAAAGVSGQVSCASCHQAENWWIDRRTTPNNTSHGTNWMIRNAATVVNSAFYAPWNETDGIRDSQWSDSLTDPEDATSMNGSRCRVAHVLFAKYKDEYNAIFTDHPLTAELDARLPADCRGPSAPAGQSDNWTSISQADQQYVNFIYANFGKAMQAYLRKIVSRNAPFDRFVAGDESAISTAAKRGLKLFIGKANCAECHAGPLFSDNKFHNIGIAVTGDHADPTETGRYAGVPVVLSNEFTSNSIYSDTADAGRIDGLTQSEDQRGQWRTKQLRSVSETAPYMHSGQFAALPDVVHFYNHGGSDAGYVGVKDEKIKVLNLTDQEQSDLVEFLKTLTGDPVPAELARDTSNP